MGPVKMEVGWQILQCPHFLGRTILKQVLHHLPKILIGLNPVAYLSYPSINVPCMGLFLSFPVSVLHSPTSFSSDHLLNKWFVLASCSWGLLLRQPNPVLIHNSSSNDQPWKSISMPDTLLSTLHMAQHLILPTASEVHTTIASILQIRKLRRREVDQPSQGPTARKLGSRFE